MKLSWYWNRLRSMEPAEVAHRLSEYARKRASRRRDGGWARYTAESLHAVFPAWREAVLAASPAQRWAIEAAAEDALQGRFAALGRDWPKRPAGQLYPADVWRLDPVTGALWPGAETYAHDIDFRHANNRGDIKYVWEFNRLQFLPALAAHLALSGDQRAREAVEAAVASWHAANPPFGGVGWASGIEVALRAISLIVALDIAEGRLSAETKRLAGEVLCASAYWLARFPSRFSSANNHLVAELAGEYLIGLAGGAEPQAVRHELLEETLKQILPDGAAAEQTPTYGAFTAELILLCAAAAAQAGHPFPDEATARLAAFAEFIEWLPAKGGFGDDDEGRALTLGGEAAYARSVAAVIRGFRGQSGAPAATDDFRAVFLGAPSSETEPREGLRTFGAGGLSVWRGAMNGRKVELSFDHGPLGYLSIAAHGHADALALGLWIDGEPVLVDPGTFLYGSGGAWRDWLRSTPAHNTLNIDGKSQSLMSGKFNWSHKAQTTLLQADAGQGWSLLARHDGYHGRFGVTHQRGVRREADNIVVTDRLLGAERVAEIVFQLAPGLEARREGRLVTVLRGDEPLIALKFPDSVLEILAGGVEPGQGGWVSPRFGKREPAGRIAWRGSVGETGVSIRIEPLPTAR